MESTLLAFILRKQAGSIAVDMVRALLGLDEEKIKDKIKHVILPWVKHILIREIQRGLYMASLQGYVSPDEPVYKKIKKFREHPEQASFSELADLMEYLTTFDIGWGGEGYIGLAKAAEKVASEPDPSFADINILVDHMHNNGGMHFLIFAPFAGLTDLEETKQMLRMDSISELLEGLEAIVKADDELSDLEKDATELKEQWVDLHQFVEKITNEIFIGDADFELNDLVHVIAELQMKCEHKTYTGPLCDRADDYLQKAKEFEKKLEYVLSKVGGGSKLLDVLVFASKKDSEAWLRQVLPYQDKMELFKEDMVQKKEHPKLKQTEEGPLPSDIIAVLPSWCEMIYGGSIEKFLNELELMLYKHVNAEVADHIVWQLQKDLLFGIAVSLAPENIFDLIIMALNNQITVLSTNKELALSHYYRGLSPEDAEKQMKKDIEFLKELISKFRALRESREKCEL